ncbi:hypothetical protein JXA85_05780 [Candidatus Woesearchaeota archaeon]|nr:hypothetical protein [Candidatus Woesearchaeota archaeon]
MHHEYIDKYSRLDSVVHKIDSRTKMILSFLLILIITAFNNFYPVLIIMPLIVIAILLSKVPVMFFLRRIAICLPFLLFLFFLPFSKAVLLFSKSASSITIITLLMSTTTFSGFLEALKFFKTPKIFILMLSFFYRYLFLFIDNIHRMRHACDSRCFSKKQSFKPATVSGMIGNLVVRSYEQSERVYLAMLARGYNDSG